MQFVIAQNAILEALQKIAGVVPTRSTTAVLENLLFNLDDGALKITGTDLEVSVTTEIAVDRMDAPGAVALPARVLIETVRSLPNIPIRFEKDENHRVKLTTDQGYYLVSGIAKENFPDIPEQSGKTAFELDNAMLARMFEKTVFAVSADELRPALMGVFLQILGDEIRMVATDGHRLSKIVNTGFHADTQPIRIIIPPKAVQIALKHLGEEGKTRLMIGPGALSFNFGKTTLYTRLVEGEYPDYERVIPRDNDKKLVVNKTLLSSTVKRVALFSSALTHQVRFTLSPGKLVVSSEDMDIGGEAKEELPVQYQDDVMEIGYNGQYLLDILKHIDTEDAAFLLKTPVRAALISPSQFNADESFMMLIMPIKLSA
jgi:DNA polymerase-3 subunit beta